MLSLLLFWGYEVVGAVPAHGCVIWVFGEGDAKVLAPIRPTFLKVGSNIIGISLCIE
jgi:hypothetical protein